MAGHEGGDAEADAGAVHAALTVSLASYRAPFAMGLVFNTAIVVVVAGRIGGAAWAVVALVSTGFAAVVAAAHRARSVTAQTPPPMLAAIDRLHAVGAATLTLGLAILSVLIVLVDRSERLGLLIGLNMIAVMAVSAEVAPGRPRLVTAQLLALAVAAALPLPTMGDETLSAATGLGLLAYTGICLSIARSRHAQERRLAEAQIAARRAGAAERASADMLHTAMRFMPHGVLITAADSRVLFLNQRLRDLLGLALDAVPPGVGWDMVFRHAAHLNIKTVAGREALIERVRLLATRGNGTSVLRLDDGRVLDCEFMRLDDGGTLLTLRDTTDEAVARETLIRDARRCPLTGLANRRAFAEELARRLAQQDGGDIVLMVADLKGFKAINDSYGHPVGDQVLTQVALRLLTLLPDAFVARLGGDEFAMLARVADAAAVTAISARAYQGLHGACDIDGVRLETEGRVGYAVSPRDGRIGVDLLRRADLALIHARQHPEIGIMPFDAALETAMRAQIAEEQAVVRVLGENRFGVVYQPWFRLADGRAMGVEALARWPDDDLPALPPCQFIRRAELMGRMPALRDQIMRQALADLADTDLEVAINISALELAQADFSDQILACAAAVRFPVSRLVLEMTESSIHANPVLSASQLGRLRGAGVHIAIDDFGSGFSALSSLAQLPVDRLKIDRSLLVAADDGQPPVLVSAAIAIGHGLGLGVVLEGVETPAQLRMVTQAGVDMVQGYWLAAPAPAHELPARLAAAAARLNDGDLLRAAGRVA